MRLRDVITDSSKSEEDWQQINHLALEYRRTEFEGGNALALISAVRYCGNEEIVMPEWVVAALFKATNKFYYFDAKTLDEAFGIEWQFKGRSLKSLKEQKRLLLPVLARVCEYSAVGWPIDDNTFEMVGEEFGIKKWKVSEIWYRHSEEAREFQLETTARNPRKTTPRPVPKI